MHGSQCQIWQPCNHIPNAFIMSKYGNSFENLQFVITFVHNTRAKHKLRICQECKSEVLVDNKDLHVTQIPNADKQFLVLIYLLFSSKFVYELAVSTNWFAYLNIMNTLWMHLCRLQIWHSLPCWQLIKGDNKVGWWKTGNY